MISDQCIQIIGLVVQVVIALVLAITFIVLLCNLNAVEKQIRLGEILNQPLCGIKEVNVKPVHPLAMEVGVTLVNAGNEVARNASISYETAAIDKKENRRDIITNLSAKGVNSITVLPRNEIKTILYYIDKKTLGEKVVGNDKFLELKLTVEYVNMKEEKVTYAASYIITRLLTDQFDNYEVTIAKSNIEPDNIFSSVIGKK